MIGNIISAGASLLGGLLGRSSAEKQAAKQEALQREFATSGIQWKVEDAKKAGVHPLYALGASTHSYSPMTVGDPLPGAISEAGNSVGRAVHATMTGDDRAAARTLQGLQIERAKLENDEIKLRLMGSQNALLTQAGTAKPMAGAGPIPMDTTFDANPRLMIGGHEVDMDPGWSPTDAVERGYGDISSVYGALKAAKDWSRATGKPFSGNLWDLLNEHGDKLQRWLAGSSQDWKFDYDPRRSRRHPAADPRSAW